MSETALRMGKTPPGMARRIIPDHVVTDAGAKPPEMVYQSSRPNVVPTPTELKETVDEPVAADPNRPTQADLNLPDWLKGVQFEEEDGVDPEAVKHLAEFKSVKDVVKSMLHTKKLVGKVTSEKAGLEKQVADLLQAKPQPEIAAATPDEAQKALKAISENFLDDIPGNINKLVETVQKITAAQAQGTITKLGEQVEAGQVEALFLGYPGLVTTAEEAAAVDALAGESKAKTTLGKYRSALTEYAKQKGYAHGETVAQVSPQTEPAPKTAPVTRVAEKKKTYNRAWLTQQASQNPDWYRSHQGEIMTAYAEGRVK